MEWEQRGHKDRLLYELTGQVSFPFMAVGLYVISSGQLIMQIAFIVSKTTEKGLKNKTVSYKQNCF